MRKSITCLLLGMSLAALIAGCQSEADKYKNSTPPPSPGAKPENAGPAKLKRLPGAMKPSG